MREIATEILAPAAPKRRVSSDSINDLLFWAAHLTLVGIALAIVWTKIDSTNSALRTLLAAQQREVLLAQAQLVSAEEQLSFAQKAEAWRSTQVKEAQASIAHIQSDVNITLAEVREINKAMLALVAQSKIAAEQAAGAAKNAAGASASTRAIVARRVVTTEDKAKIIQQQRALAQKKQQLSQTIRQVKKKGPTLLQKMFQ